MISADESARQIKLGGGRMLGYDEHGDPGLCLANLRWYGG
jgi:hypothetical protein